MCGVFGIAGHPEAKHILPTILMSLQHRGHDAAGVAGLVDTDPNCIDTIKGAGKIGNVLTVEGMDKFIGECFIAHTRYSTRNAAKSVREIHPHWAQSMLGRIVIVTNGDIINVDELLEFVNSQNVKVYTKNDAELIAALINIERRQNDREMFQSIHHAMSRVKGGFAGLVMSEDENKVYAFRDPWGIRPLHLCEFNIGGKKSVAVASETCAFDIIQRYNLSKFPDVAISAEYREVQPGEILSFDAQGKIENAFFQEPPSKNIGCVFEAIYFARPDSSLRGESFQVIRERMGVELFKEKQIDADLVTSVPKGGIPAAVGYAKASGLPYSIAILEEPSTGGFRSFITSADERQAFARMKYSVLSDVVKGKKIVVIDDSIVRGTTAKLLVKSLFLAGAKEVHVRIPAPPYDHPCHYGIETKDPESLISHGRTEEEVCEILGATSLHYLSLEGLYRAIGQERKLFCDECLSGKSPITS